MDSGEMGTIKMMSEKGFGFISRPSGGKDVFFHAKDLPQGIAFADFKSGDKVVFDLENREKGPVAVNLTHAE